MNGDDIVMKSMIPEEIVKGNGVDIQDVEVKEETDLRGRSVIRYKKQSSMLTRAMEEVRLLAPPNYLKL